MDTNAKTEEVLKVAELEISLGRELTESELSIYNIAFRDGIVCQLKDELQRMENNGQYKPLK